MAGINKLQEVFTQFKATRTIEGGERAPLEDREECRHEATHFMDSFLPHYDESGEDIFPGEGQLTIPIYQGVGTLTAHFSGNSEAGQAESSYFDGLQLFSRQLYFDENAIDSFSVRMHNTGYEDVVEAVHHHVDRDNPEDSYQVTRHWHVSPWG